MNATAAFSVADTRGLSRILMAVGNRNLSVPSAGKIVAGEVRFNDTPTYLVYPVTQTSAFYLRISVSRATVD